MRFLPLKQHIKRSIRYHLGNLDKKIVKLLTQGSEFTPIKLDKHMTTEPLLAAIQYIQIVDLDNFNEYNKAPRRPTLKIYLMIRQKVFKMLIRLRQAKVKKGY
jgi:hypothetical protein